MVWHSIQVASHWFQKKDETVWCSFLIRIKLDPGKIGRAEIQLRHSAFKAYWYPSLLLGLYALWYLILFLSIRPQPMLMILNQVSASPSSRIIWSVEFGSQSFHQILRQNFVELGAKNCCLTWNQIQLQAFSHYLRTNAPSVAQGSILLAVFHFAVLHSHHLMKSCTSPIICTQWFAVFTPGPRETFDEAWLMDQGEKKRRYQLVLRKLEGQMSRWLSSQHSTSFFYALVHA